MISFKYTVILFIFIGQCASAQSRIDSLTLTLHQASGIQRVELLNELTYEFISRDNVKAMQYCDQAIALGSKLGYQKGVGRAYTYRGVYEYLSGAFSDGRINLRRGLDLAIKSSDRENQGYSLVQIGNSFLNSAQLDSSLYFFNQAYTVLKDSTNPAALSKLYRNLSALYGIRSQNEWQKKYLIRAIRIRALLKDTSLIADAMIALVRMNINENDYLAATENLNKVKRLLESKALELEYLNDWRHQQALLLLHERKFDQALVLFDSAIKYYARNSHLQKYVTIQTDLGKIFNDRGEYETALQCFYDALEVAQLKGFGIEIADIQLQIGWASFNLGDLKESLDLANVALSWVENHAIPSRVSDALILKGISLNGMKDFANAKICFEKALAIRQKIKNNPKISEAYENLGYMELNRGNYEASLNYYQKSLPFANVSNYEFGRVWSLLGIGHTNSKLGYFKPAAEYLAQAEKQAIQIDAREALIYVYEAQRDLLAAQKKFKESLNYSIKAYSLRDSLHRTEVGRRFANLQHSDEIKQRDRNIQVLTQEKLLAQDKIALQELRLRQQYFLIVLSVAVIGLFAALAVVYARFYFKVKRLNDDINQQKEEIQAQSNYISLLNKNLQDLVDEKTTELQRTNDELMKQNDDLLQFSYTVSHNLRGPVARMLGLTNIFRYSRDTAEQNQMINLVHQSSEDLDRTLKDLSKIIDIRNDLHSIKEWVSLEEKWLICCSLLKDVIKDEFRISHNFGRAPKIYTVKAFVQSVFYNLLSNSIKYRSDERDLVVSVNSFTEEDKLIIEIKDNGLGIDIEKHKDSIFKLFKRFHTHVEGRGLGLYLIKSQIEALKGSFEIQSVVNQGTCIRLSIPTVTATYPETIDENNGPRE